MKKNLPGKKLNSRGFSLVIFLTVAVLGALIIMALVPALINFSKKSDSVGCASSLDTAERELKAEYLLNGGILDTERALKLTDTVMSGWEELCPGNGTVYLTKDESLEFPYRFVCGKHCTDPKEKTRLNAEYAYENLIRELKAYDDPGKVSTIKIKMNGKTIKAEKVSEIPDIARGTDLTKGYSGVVILYMQGDDGTPEYFIYADEEHCAIRTDGVWSGDSYK